MAASNMTCTTPIALNQTNTGTIAMKWFVDKAEYPATYGTYQYLINGEAAFGAVYDAIAKATKTVDIICWGFQPSMYFKRGKDKALRIGELLRKLDATGTVKVRLLCWHDPLYIAALSENNMPGYDGTTDVKSVLPGRVSEVVSQLTTLYSADYQTKEELNFDNDWYRGANMNNVTKFSAVKAATPMGLWTTYNGAYNQRYHKEDAFKNLEFATRTFSVSERSEIFGRLRSYEKAQGYDPRLIAGNTQGMVAEPTHHQKMVLIDYEDPELATGFVMGHNMLDQYWDTSRHNFKPAASPADGRNGLSPWQDISGRLTGPILQYLNDNFCTAWDDATGKGLAKSRAHVDPCSLKMRDDGDNTKVMAQVLRTQSQKGKEDIGRMYLQAVNNATQYIFFQNQYFRWQELGDKIKSVAKSHVAGGRDPGKHGPIYLFVITNSSTAAVGNGTVATYQMLDSLGYGNSMPGVAQLERAPDLTAQQKALEAQLAQQQAGAQRLQSTPASPFDGSAMSLASAYQQNQMDQLETQQKLDDIKNKIAANEHISADTPPTPVEGLKIQICTLVAPDSPGGNWADVYVHAKVMTIDDAFVTQGSANINTRSMKVDSELNFCSESGDIARNLRLDLFRLHTADRQGNPRSDLEKPEQAFNAWDDIISRNKTRKNRGGAPVASLVAFLRVENDRSFKD